MKKVSGTVSRSCPYEKTGTGAVFSTPETTASSDSSPIIHRSSFIVHRFLLCVLCASAVNLAAAPSTQPAQRIDFDNAQPGPPPDDLLILSGDFAIKKENNNTFLELAPTPIDSHALLLGPESASSISARIFASSTGKRFPEFGVGLAGASGYKLQLMPAVNQLQLIKNEDTVATTPYTWTSAAWTHFRLQLTKLPTGKYQIQGKAWPQDTPEPQSWTLTWTDPDDPLTGRPSLFATPYSETPTRFDDITVFP